MLVIILCVSALGWTFLCNWCSTAGNWGFALYVSGVTFPMMDETAGIYS